jgi:hypothetical protein
MFALRHSSPASGGESASRLRPADPFNKAWSSIRLANGFLQRNNIDPTVGSRFRF